MKLASSFYTNQIEPKLAKPAAITTAVENASFDHLLSPLRIGNLTVRNRVFTSAHGTGFPNQNGVIGDRHIAYQLERAKGGIGLVVIEATSVDDTPIGAGTSAGSRSLRNTDDACLEGYRRLSEALHAQGTKVFCLLSHSGRNTVMGPEGEPPLAPSALPMDRTRDVPHALEIYEIQRIVAAFAAAAKRCRDGGLDGVELSFTHGNLVQQFLSPESNVRTDEYGGSEENRLRLAREVLQACRAAIGDDFVFGIRFSADELVEQGYGLEAGVRYAKLMIEWGKLDYIDVSAGTNSSMWSRSAHYPTISYPTAPLVPLARAVRDAVDIPVFTVGKIGDPHEAEAIVARGDADMVAMTRAHIAEPELVNKIREKQFDDIRSCIYCNESCFSRQQRVGDISCVYNPRSGRESFWKPIDRVAQAQHVVVIGGGAAGLEAARVAAKRGHRVSLYEAGDVLGGQVRFAARTPHRAGYLKIVDWLEHQARKLGVKIHLGSPLDAEAVFALQADHVIVATGARDERPAIAGADLPHVFSAREALGDATLGKRIVVGDWDGRHMGVSVAEALATRGHHVALVSSAFFIGMDIDLLTWRPQYERLLKLGVALHALEEIVGVDADAAIVRRLDHQNYRLPADSVVLCSRGAAERSIYQALHGRIASLHAIGDSWAPRQLEQAIYEGARLARSL